MSRYGSITALTAAKTVFVQSADPVDLENRVNAAIASLFAGAQTPVVASIYLAGAGDGHTFVVEITRSVTGDFTAITGPASLLITSPNASERVTCYMAADSSQLPVQRDRAMSTRGGTRTAVANIYDEELAGASKGTRFMGLIVETGTFAP